MKPREELSQEAHHRDVAAHGGSPEQAFSALVARCLCRWAEQNDLKPLPADFAAHYAEHLWEVVNDAGLPPPLPDGEAGEPGEMNDYDIAVLIAAVFAGLPHGERHGELDTPTRQLLKACLQPEFRKCRDSYREVVNGSCRRQQLEKALSRVSGSHCVDCPYWIAFRPEPHAGFLARAWVTGNPGDFSRHREIFLPEDFRALRIFIWRHARAAGSS